MAWLMSRLTKRATGEASSLSSCSRSTSFFAVAAISCDSSVNSALARRNRLMQSRTCDGMATMAMTGMPVVAETSSTAAKFFGFAMATAMRPLTMESGRSWLRRHRSSGTMLMTSLSIWYSLRSTNGRLMPCANAMAYWRSVCSSMPSVDVGMAGKSPVTSLVIAAWRGMLGVNT